MKILTATEAKIVSLIVDKDLSNKEVAHILHYSASTINYYLQKVYRKLGFKPFVPSDRGFRRYHLVALERAIHNYRQRQNAV